MRRFAAPLLIGLIGCAILLGLGVWQMQRLAWKSGIIGTIQARMSLPPTILPPAPTAEGDAYRAIALNGAFLPGELHVLTSTRAGGPGFRIIAPYAHLNRRILVDRGFVPQALKDAARPAGAAAIQGHLVWPDETDGFTPEPDLAENFWFARDVVRMAATLGTEPLMVQLSEPAGEAAPQPIPVTPNIRNAHLQYAVTWFCLAFVWAGMSGYWALHIRRRGQAAKG